MGDVINYFYSEKQMGDLLKSMNVSIKDDFSDEEREKLRKYLESYMTSNACHKSVKIDLKKFYLVIRGADEASYLYQYLV